VTVSGSGIGGAGAIINTGAAQISALQSLVLQNNTTFGGSARLDLRAGTVASLDTGGQPFNLIKTGTNQVSLVSITNVDAALGDIDIQQGTFSVQSFTGQIGDPTKNLIVRSNASLHLFSLNLFPLDKVISVANGGIITNESGASAIIGSLSVTGRVTFGIAGTSLTISNNNGFAGTSVTNLIKNGSGSLVLISNSLPGSTLIDLAAGLLDLRQSVSQTLTLASGQTIKGNGTLAGTLAANPGSIVSPGASIGTLTISNSISLAGTTVMEINKTTATNDVLRSVSSSITYGGTLVVTNLAGTFVGNETFKLFNAQSYSGIFATNFPALPGGLSWNTNQLAVNGTISINVSILPPPTIASIVQSGTNVIISGTNNLGSAGSYYVLTTTNIAQPRTNWTRMATNSFDAGGNFKFTNGMGTNFSQQFYLLQLP
jgi:hypothetical protein